jgi:hypothetical protein
MALPPKHGIPVLVSIVNQAARKLPETPSIQPSTSATVRSDSVKSGLKNAARLPSRSARDSQAATQ